MLKRRGRLAAIEEGLLGALVGRNCVARLGVAAGWPWSALDPVRLPWPHPRPKLPLPRSPWSLKLPLPRPRGHCTHTRSCPCPPSVVPAPTPEATPVSQPAAHTRSCPVRPQPVPPEPNPFRDQPDSSETDTPPEPAGVPLSCGPDTAEIKENPVCPSFQSASTGRTDRSLKETVLHTTPDNPNRRARYQLV